MRKRKPIRHMPVPLSALLPARLLKMIRSDLSGKGSYEARAVLRGISGEQGEGNAEVFIHLSSRALSAFGHVDIAIQDTVYSYGNYDAETHRLFGLISRGIVAIVPREPYIEYALKVEEKILIGYKLSLTRELLTRMKEKAKDMMPELIPWEAPVDRWEKAGCQGDAPQDACSRLSREAGAKYYRVGKRKYKWFFALNTNCVRFADELLSAIGLTQTRLSGTLTPGEYAIHLEKLLAAPDIQQALITQRTVYADVPDAN